MSSNQSYLGIITNGLIRENPTFVLVLGMCPTLGTTTSAINGLGMGLATMFVLIGANMVIAAIKGGIPDKVRYSYIRYHRPDDHGGLPSRTAQKPRGLHPANCCELYYSGACRSLRC